MALFGRKWRLKVTLRGNHIVVLVLPLRIKRRIYLKDKRIGAEKMPF